ncbi:MAG: DHH family phosphoesterase, partial [Candidatus Omnitrophota bacterium]|nr:DHH family phosphoesterase [Candidatus Omnitrophota bacterium]
MKHWNIRQPDITRQKILTDSLGVSPVTAQLLINRKLSGLDQAKTFLSGTISELYNPFLMEGMHEAVSRIKKAIENKEKILIHGDYDVDGVTSIALLIYTFRSFGVDVSYYIPDRLTEGYGLSKGGVEEAIKIGATLVITVDCGISSNEEVDSLRNKNIDVIITDHHEVPDIPPQAYAIVNPRMKNCAYPDKNLAGVGIAFKLAEALCSILKSSEVWRHFDLVSLGTVADIVPLTGENRIIVKEGMKLLNNGTHKVGLKALIEASGLKDKPLGSFAISYILGPRINA